MKVFLAGSLSAESKEFATLKSQIKGELFDSIHIAHDNQNFMKIRDAHIQCDFLLYVIAPGMKGFDDIIQVVDDSNKLSGKTGYFFLEASREGDFTAHQIKSLNAIGKMVKKNGAHWFKSLDDAITHINSLTA